VGDTIEAQVIKTNDVEGTATLSRKRMEAQKAWQQISEAEENGAILAGKISSAVNGGVVVTYESNRIFIPASQITSDREADLSMLVGQTVQFKIIEVDKRRRRVIGSVKRASSEMRKEARERILAEIEVGKHYEGTVRSLTSYGAFVDIGGVDGMVHITELSWSKLRHPNEVVNVGDVIDVYVKEFNEETGRISLGYKDPNANPMDTFRNNYNVDDIVDAKIVKLMKYGAFAEIIPGIDGLIHISEIAPEHIEKVSDKLKVGDVVSAKIIEIDFERNRISLSIKAALPVEEVAEEEVAQEAPVEE
jgi:4-hydroxy-3-methylbut-2-enyl diphosphate reductase